jgi:hypothetical protein
MKQLEVLIFGKNQPILEILIRLVNGNKEWHAVGFTDDALTKEHYQKHTPDMVLLSSGIDEECEKKMRSFFIELQPEIQIIQHYGGGSGLLNCEILETLEKLRKRKLSNKESKGI